MPGPGSKTFPRVLSVIGAVWLLLGFAAVPPVVRQAYRGESVDFLNGIFAAHQAQGLDFFLGEWYKITIYGALVCFALAGFAYLLLMPSSARRIVGEATPGELGAMRALVCGVLLMNVLWEDLPSTAAMPREMLMPMGLMEVFYLLPLGFERLLDSPAALWILQALTAVVLFLAMVGWKTRWTLPSAALLYFVFGGILRQYAKLFHTGLIPLYLLVVLALIPLRHGWSADSLIRRWKGTAAPGADEPTAQYGWARYAVWTVFALSYVEAGLSKLRNGGLFWWDAVNFKYNMLYCTVRPMEFDFKISLALVSAPDVLFEVMALTALFGELLYGSVLFSRKARWFFPALMLLMHLGILFLQNILFFDLILLQLLFIDFRLLRRKAGAALASRRGRIELRAGGAGHAWLPGMLRALDLFGRVDLVEEPAAGRSTSPGWEGIYQGETYRGIRLARLLARALPALWLVLPFLYLPGASGAARRVLVAAERDGGASIPAASPPARKTWAASPRFVLTLASVMLLIWTLRVEIYPFTGMQMFSKVRGSLVEYEVVSATLTTGEERPAPIAESIGAMADSRFRRVLEMAFDEEEAPLADEFFQVVIRRWNSTATKDQQIRQIEVQRRAWDFIEDPDDPEYGRLIDHRVYVAPPP